MIVARRGKTFGGDEAADDGNHDREKYLGRLGDGLLVRLHHDRTLFFGRKHPHDGGLEHGHERHVRVRCNGYGPEQVWRVLRRNVNDRRAIACPDNADCDCFLVRKIEGQGQKKRQEDAELAGCPEEEGIWILQNRSKVSHRTYAHKDEKGKEFRYDAHVINNSQEPVFLHESGKGNVDHDAAESYRNQKQRLKILLNSEVEEQTADGHHHNIGPLEVSKPGNKSRQPAHNCFNHNLFLLVFLHASLVTLLLLSCTGTSS